MPTPINALVTSFHNALLCCSQDHWPRCFTDSPFLQFFQISSTILWSHSQDSFSRLLCIPRIVRYHILLPLFLTCPSFCQRARSCSVPLVLDCISNSLPLTNFLPVNFKKIQNQAGQSDHHFFVTKTCQVCQHKPGTKINLFSWSHWNTTNCVS